VCSSDLTKHRLCHGTRSSVVWDEVGNKAAEGCLESSKIDLDPSAAGLQTKCTVTELRSAKGADGKQVFEPSGKAFEACDPAAVGGHHGGEHGEAKGKFPCYVLSMQPAVCPKWPAALVYFGDHEKHPDIRVKVECEAPAAPATTDPFAAVAHDERVGVSLINPPKQLTKHELNEAYAAGPPPPNTNMFFSIYFAMTGLHGIHVLVGVGIFIWLLIRSIRGHFTPDYFGPIDYAALYWHIVDLIWIFLFPLLYLIH
jgi:hypothetical protein